MWQSGRQVPGEHDANRAETMAAFAWAICVQNMRREGFPQPHEPGSAARADFFWSLYGRETRSHVLEPP